MIAAIVAFAVGSLVCWLVVASTPGLRRTVALLLAVSGIAQIAVGCGWIFTDQTYSVLVILALASVVLLISGIVAEEGRQDAVPFRYARLHVRLGTLLSGAFSFVTVALVVFFVFGVLAFGRPASTPPSSQVLPLPPGLTILTNVDHGCGGVSGPQMVCSREIDVRMPSASSAGNGKGGSGAQARTLLRDELALGTAAAHAAVHGLQGSYGWSFTPATPGSWHACRTTGWWLDTHTVCASVSVRAATAVVTLDVASDWLALLS
ncbi:MAG TPA: hypothetical protein VMG38_26545 [Trebonia sp.]|nr:hypothetical protein [Trebonia sp.]